MKNKPILLLGCLLALNSFSGQAQADEQTDQLQKEVDQLKNEVKSLKYGEKYTQSKQESLSAALKRVRVNGFLNAGYSTLDSGGSQSGLNFYGTRDALTSTNELVAGFQIDVKVTDKLKSSIQLVARGIESSDVTASWAYFGYEATDSLSIRGGRLRLPFYAFSEFIDVGYAYPWTRPPIELYNLPLNNYEGFDGLYKYNIGEVQASVQALFGSAEDSDPLNEVDFTLDELWGIVFSFSYDDLSGRVAYHRAHSTLSPWAGSAGEAATEGLALADVTAAGLNDLLATDFYTEFAPSTADYYAAFTSAAVIYDDGTWFIAAEIAQLEVDYALFPAGDSGYVTVGRNFGKWMPYVTAGTYYTNSKNDEMRNERADELDRMVSEGLDPLGNTIIDPDTGTTAAQAAAGFSELSAGLRASNLQQDSYSLGVNYSVTQGLKLKLQATLYNDFGGTNGLFSGSPGKDQAVYTFMANMVY